MSWQGEAGRLGSEAVARPLRQTDKTDRQASGQTKRQAQATSIDQPALALVTWAEVVRSVRGELGAGQLHAGSRESTGCDSYEGESGLFALFL
ncbi:hypothetical protein KTAU_34530 [Thermogemmatispora aurantia]|uniref:Uncharacterized protein n=1 Tax=Thermogemmatispora aurantia TaxID=2045279 RepID=A0A5J4KDU9_9CHLR|nr:hypothetical protein KTAU_34530 [Thermogemmatispora aurantia]